MGEDTRDEKSGGGIVQSIKQGAHWDVAVSGWALAHGVPIPPSIVKRVRVGVGRLIDGGFAVGEAWLSNVHAKQVFDGERTRATVLAVSEAGTQRLIDSDQNLPLAVARSYFNEHKLKFDNRANVAQAALDELGRTSFAHQDATEDDASIELDWLNHFSEIAGQKSTPEMQLLFGKILAGEIRKPGSFSPMSINVLANLTPVIAKKFEKLCSVSIKFETKCFVSIDMFPNFTNIGIPKLEFAYTDLLLLRQYQLLAFEGGTKLDIPIGDRFTFTVGERMYGLEALAHSEEPMGSLRAFQVASFSSVGNELRTLIQPNQPEWVDELISTTFTSPKWGLAKFPNSR